MNPPILPAVTFDVPARGLAFATRSSKLLGAQNTAMMISTQCERLMKSAGFGAKLSR